MVKGIVHPKNINSVINNSPSCRFKHVSSSFQPSSENKLRYFWWNRRAFWPSIDRNAIFRKVVRTRDGSIPLFQNRYRYQQFWVFADTDIDPIPAILSICRYRYRSDTSNSEYLPIPISIRYQQFWVSADTDIDPIPAILSICRYRYRSDTSNSEYLPIPISIRYQQFWVSADTDIDPIPAILSICRYRYRSDTSNSEYLPIPISIRYQQFWVSADTDIDPIPAILSICRYRYRSDTSNSEYLPIPISIRYQQFWVSADTDIDPIPAQFFYISVEFLYLSVCWPAHHSFVFYTQSTKYRQLYCKEKRKTTNEWICNYNLWQKYFYKLG